MPGRSGSVRIFRHITEANASTSTDSVTVTGSLSGPGRSMVRRSGTNAARAPRSARKNSTASRTLRSALVDSNSMESTRVNSADRCER